MNFLVALQICWYTQDSAEQIIKSSSILQRIFASEIIISIPIEFNRSWPLRRKQLTSASWKRMMNSKSFQLKVNARFCRNVIRRNFQMSLVHWILEWDTKQEDQTDVNVWEDNWDDDAIEDDFSIQLRSELENQGMKMET